MSTALSFEIDPSDYLSLDFESHRNSMYKLAISSPANYFELREKIVKAVRDDMVKKVYSSIFKLMTAGKNLDGLEIDVRFKPSFPKQLAAKEALSAAMSIQDLTESIIDTLLPADFKKLAERRTMDKSKSDGIDA